ncbi:MAG TPA: winged helix-turn-helix domain-containing protein [Bryobacteraceae bacterium]|nr:winged helix-turn-helix domain-containing protein [Bryobacteraceae bacterium]
MPGADLQEFGPFRYDPAQRQLFRDGQPVPLVPKAIDTLHVLLERRGQIVDKATLLQLVWPGTTVEEIGLARNISILRKALGDDGDTPRYIETIPKRGYRFAAAAAPKPAPVKPRLWIPAAALLALAVFIWWQFYLPSRYLPPGERMAQIAVLPFEPLDATLPGSLPAALNEQIVAELVRTGGMRVISPSTVARYRRFAIPSSIMARVLGLDVVLEGALQPASDSVRITARLADVHSGKLIWAETLESPSADLSAASSQIAARIRSHLVLAKP